jgi:uncharacterized protein (TIGR03382 family)
MQDYEYLNLLVQLGDGAFAQTQLATVVTAANSFASNPAVLEAARLAMAAEIEADLATGGTSGGTGGTGTSSSTGGASSGGGTSAGSSNSGSNGTGSSGAGTTGGKAGSSGGTSGGASAGSSSGGKATTSGSTAGSAGGSTGTTGSNQAVGGCNCGTGGSPVALWPWILLSLGLRRARRAETG